MLSFTNDINEIVSFSIYDNISEEIVDVKRKLPFSSGQLVLVRKVSETPEMFPRKAGIPQKRPLY